MHRLALSFIFFGALAVSAASAEWTPKTIHGIEYPRLALLSRTEGTVEVECVVRSDGTVAQVYILSGTQLLAEPSQENARKWKFRKEGVTENSGDRFVLRYVFRIDGVASARRPTAFSFDFPNVVVVSSPSIHWMPQKASTR